MNEDERVEITLHEPITSSTENASQPDQNLMAEQRFVVERTEAIRKELEEKLDSKHLHMILECFCLCFHCFNQF